MKKLLNISVIAALAILPLAANATDLTPEQLAHAASADNDGTTVATASYVKGAYNELGTAINTKQDKLSTEQLSAIQNVSGLNTRLGTAETDISALKTAVGSAASGLTKDVADLNTSLATKADVATTYTKTEVDSALDAKADASTTYTKTEVDSALDAKANAETTYTKTDVDTKLADKQDNLTTDQLAAVDSGITGEKVADYDSLVTNSANYATKTGVTATINASNVTVPVLTTCGSNTATNMEASIAAATYTEPAPAVEQ